jgi:hypothetical protein
MEEEEATQGRNNATVKLKTQKRGEQIKIQSDNGESRDRDSSGYRPNAHPTSKFNSTEQQHISYSSFMSIAPLGKIGRKQERVIKT